MLVASHLIVSALISFFILLFRLVNRGSLLKINFIFNYLIAVLLFFSIFNTSTNKVFDRITGVKKFSNKLYDIIEDKEIINVYCKPGNFGEIKNTLENKFCEPVKAKLVWQIENSISVDKQIGIKILNT